MLYLCFHVPCQCLAAIRALGEGGGGSRGPWENKEAEGHLASGEGSLECEKSP